MLSMPERKHAMVAVRVVRQGVGGFLQKAGMAGSSVRRR